LRQITEGLGALDAEVFEAVANARSPLRDTTMPALTRAADHAKLWLAIAAAMATSSNRSARRGAGRGVVSLAATSVITNQLAKRLWRRERPPFRVSPPHTASVAKPDVAFDRFRQDMPWASRRRRSSLHGHCTTGSSGPQVPESLSGRPR
jgi:hypothetical protein